MQWLISGLWALQQGTYNWRRLDTGDTNSGGTGTDGTDSGSGSVIASIRPKTCVFFFFSAVRRQSREL